MGEVKRERKKHNTPYFPSYAESRLGHTHEKADRHYLQGESCTLRLQGRRAGRSNAESITIQINDRSQRSP